MSEHTIKSATRTNMFLTYSWRCPISNKLQQLEFKLEFRNMQEKLENYFFALRFHRKFRGKFHMIDVI